MAGAWMGGRASHDDDHPEDTLTDTAERKTTEVVDAPTPAARAEPVGRGPRPGRFRGPAGWLLLVLALTATVGLVLRRRFYYGNDDLLQFAIARDKGLSWDMLTLNVYQHFGPYNRMGHLLVFRFTDLSPAPGLALVLANYAVLLAAVLWLLTELRLSTARRVVALVLIGLSVTVSESAVWFDAGMHILPAIAMTLAVCAAHVRGVRGGSPWWHATALVLFLLGQLTQERPIFALPLVVLVDVFLLWRHLPVRTRLRRLWAQRWPLASLAVAAAAISLALRALVVQDVLSTPSWSVTGRTALAAFSDYVVPSLANRTVAAPLDLTRQLLVLAGVLLVGVILARLVPGNAGPLLFAAATFVLYYGFLKLSPLLTEDSIQFNAERLHNAVYVTVPAVIGLVHLRLPSRSGRATADGGEPAPGRGPAWRRSLQVTGCLVLAGYLLVTDIAYLDRRWSDTTEARAYLDTVRAAAPEWASPDVTLVPLLAHPAMATSWSGPLARHDRLLDLIVKGFAPGDLGPRPVLIDDRGDVRPAALQHLRSTQIVEGACGAPEPDDGRRPDDGSVAVSSPSVSSEALFLLVRYRASADMSIQPAAGWDTEWLPNAQPSKVYRGTHTQLIPLDSTLLDIVDVAPENPEEDLCLLEASLVRPVIVEDGGDRCAVVDRYGTPGRTVPCPPA